MEISFVTRKFQRSIAGFSLLAILASFAGFGTAAAMSFDDVANNHFAAEQIDALSDAGIMTGYENGTFGPDDVLTREQAAKILVLAFVGSADMDAEVTCSGQVSSWATAYVATANLHGILEGDDEGNCNAMDNVKRAEFAKMVVNASGLSNDGTMASDMFDDVVAGSWYDEVMGTAYVYGVMGGYQNGDMGPADSVTRGQAAKMTYNAMNPKYDPVDPDPDPDPTPNPTGGDLEIILSSESADDYTYFSVGTNAEVAVFELTAADEDVLVTSFQVELASGLSGSIDALALYNEAGTRISNVDTSIDSDDMARMSMLEGGYTIEAGTSEMFRLINTFAAGASTSTLYSYAFDASMIESNATEVEVEDDLVTGIFGLLVNDTGRIAITDENIPTEVQVGETDAELFTFEVDETSNDKDVWLMGITFENTEGANLDEAVSDLELYFDGDMVAEGTQFGDYISFQMDEDTAPMIEEGTSESFEVRARIIGESSEDLLFDIENPLDVRAVDEDGNSVAVIEGYTGAITNIDAGAISVVAYDSQVDKFRADRDDIELGSFELTPGTDGMELVSLNININLVEEEDDGGETWFVSDLFENFQVRVNGTNYGLDRLGVASANETYNVELDRTLLEGTVYEFVVYADTVTTTAAAATATASLRDGLTYDIDSYTNFAVEMALANLGTGDTTDGIVVEETASGDEVTDFTPSAVSFNQLDGETSGVDISALTLSSTKTAVIGAEDVLALEFEVEEDADVSDLTIKDLNVSVKVDENDDGTFAASGEDATNSNITSIDLYQVSSTGTETLLDSVSGSQIGAHEVSEGTLVNFDFGDVVVDQNSKEKFRVYVSFVDDEAIGGDDFRVVVSEYDIRDDENNEAYDSSDVDADGDFYGADVQPTSGRTISLVSVGTLYVNVDNDDDTYGTEAARWLLAGEKGVGLMTIEVRATNEDVTIEDYALTMAGAEDDMSEYFETIYVYNEDGILVGSKTLSDEAATVTFDSSSTELFAPAEQTVSYYFVADLLAYGKDYAGERDDATATPGTTFAFLATDVTGNDSNDTYLGENVDLDTDLDAGEIIYEGADNNAATTAVSETFDVIATRLSNVAFVSSAGGQSVDTSLTNGENTVAILAITADDTNNTESNGTDIASLLQGVSLDVYFELGGAGDINSMRIERIGTSAEAVGSTPATSGDPSLFNIATSFLNAVDEEVDPGETVYLEVIADVTLDTAVDGEYIQVRVDNINGTWLTWADSVTGTPVTRHGVYMGDQDRITATKVNELN